MHGSCFLSSLTSKCMHWEGFYYDFSTEKLWTPKVPVPMQGRSQTFQNEGTARGAQGWAGGADWDSKWRLSIDLCTKCNFIWGARGAEFLPGGSCPPHLPPPPPPPPATPLAPCNNLPWHSPCMCCDQAKWAGICKYIWPNKAYNIFSTLQLPNLCNHLTNFNRVCCRRLLCTWCIQSTRKIKILLDLITYA